MQNGFETMPSRLLHKDKLSDNLITYLRRLFKNKDIVYSKLLIRLLGGHERIIFKFQLRGITGKFSRPLVLRLFQKECEPNETRFESIIQNVLFTLGFPAAHVLHVCVDKAVLGGVFMIMEFLPGKNMRELFFRPSKSIFQLPRILARIQAQLHTFNPLSVLRVLEKEGFDTSKYTFKGVLKDLELRINRAELHGLKRGLLWAFKNQSSPISRRVICHGDITFGNVLYISGKVSGVTDWGHCTIGEPEFDVATSRILLGRGLINKNKLFQKYINPIRSQIIRQYYNEYRQHNALDSRKVQYYEGVACLRDLVEWSYLNELKSKSSNVIHYTLSQFKKASGIELHV